MRFVPTAVFMAAGLAAAAPSALAQTGPIEVIFCKKGGDPKAAIPGWVDHSGAPLAVQFKAMNQVYVAPDGSQWMVGAMAVDAANSIANNDIGFVYGTGTTGSVLALGGITFVEGQPIPDTGKFMDHTGVTNVANWNDAGDMVFGFSLRPDQASTSGSNERRIYTWDGTSLTFMAHTGDQYAGALTGGSAVGTSINNYHILNDGRVGFLDSNSPSPTPSSQRPLLSYIPAGGGLPSVLLQNSLPVLDIDGLTPINLTGLGANDFFTTRNGEHWYAVGNVALSIGGPSVFILKNPAGNPVGRAALKSDTELAPGSGIYPTRFSSDFLDTVLLESGEWYVRGQYAISPNSTDDVGTYIVKNGTLLVREGDPITPGSTETWTDLLGIAANNSGDYIVVGKTSAAEEANEIVLLNGAEIVLREGEPVDLDGNGQFDDSAFIGRGTNTSTALGSGQWRLTDTGVLYAVVMLRDGEVSGNDINSTAAPTFGTPQAFIRRAIVGTTPPCYANCDNSTTEPVLNVADFSCFLQEFAQGSAYANCDGSTTEPVLNVADFSCFLQEFAGGCR